MIVVDASAIVHLLLTTHADLVFERIVRGEAVAPYVIDLEVVHALRRRDLRGLISDERALEAIADFATLPIRRYPHEPFLRRMWHLRQNVTAYDAAYVALAESLDAPLVTRDARLARSSGHAARIEYIA